MKKNLCLNIIVLLFPLYANSQSVDSLSLYQSAITFISADLDILQKEVAVSGIAYDLDCFMFIDSVKNSSLEKILHEKQDKPTPDVYSSILDRNFNKLSPQTEYSIFFSRIKDGFFLAQVYRLQEYGKSVNYESVINTALQQYYYMFVLNQEQKIKKVFRMKMD